MNREDKLSLGVIKHGSPPRAARRVVVSPASDLTVLKKRTAPEGAVLPSPRPCQTRPFGPSLVSLLAADRVPVSPPVCSLPERCVSSPRFLRQLANSSENFL